MPGNGLIADRTTRSSPRANVLDAVSAEVHACLKKQSRSQHASERGVEAGTVLDGRAGIGIDPSQAKCQTQAESGPKNGITRRRVCRLLSAHHRQRKTHE